MTEKELKELEKFAKKWIQRRAKRYIFKGSF